MPSGRPPLERMMQIHDRIRSGKYPNNSTFAKEMGVSTKSIQRDITFMRDRMKLPIEYDSRRYGYYYTQAVSSFPSIQVSEGELFALLVAEKALQQYRGTPFEGPLLSAFKKMAAGLPDTISLSLADWEQTISFRTSAESLVNLGVFDTLAKATARQHRVELSYRKPGQAQPEKRVVDPYHLANINGEWFLFAFDHLRKQIRTFAIVRIKSARMSDEEFKRPAKFSVEQTLRDSFGVVAGEGNHEVVIHFDEAVADYIWEKRWHPSQKLKALPKNCVEMRLRLSSLPEVERWILSWAGHAVPKSPAELVENVRLAGERIAGRNGGRRP